MIKKKKTTKKKRMKRPKHKAHLISGLIKDYKLEAFSKTPKDLFKISSKIMKIKGFTMPKVKKGLF